MSVERLLEWADEHLMYEVDTLVYATLELGDLPEKRSSRENTLLESSPSMLAASTTSSGTTETIRSRAMHCHGLLCAGGLGAGA